MEKFTKLTGVAAPLPIVNVDTDMIIPKDYLKTIKRTGLGTGLFAEMRYNEDGSENPDFVLNKPAYRKAQILVAGDNFGCGSSREHAPWALLDFGIRCVISTSFADIFYNNCFKNGILPITVSPEDLEKLMDDASRGSNATLSVDLEAKEIRGPDGGVVKFDLDDFKRHCLLNGLDDIGLTMEKAAVHRHLREEERRDPPLGVKPGSGPAASAKRCTGWSDRHATFVRGLRASPVAGRQLRWRMARTLLVSHELDRPLAPADRRNAPTRAGSRADPVRGRHADHHPDRGYGDRMLAFDGKELASNYVVFFDRTVEVAGHQGGAVRCRRWRQCLRPGHGHRLEAGRRRAREHRRSGEDDCGAPPAAVTDDAIYFVPYLLPGDTAAGAELVAVGTACRIAGQLTYVPEPGTALEGHRPVEVRQHPRLLPQ